MPHDHQPCLRSQGSSSSLPEEWEEHKDPEGLVYFHNEKMNVSSRQVTARIHAQTRREHALMKHRMRRQHPSDEAQRNLYYAHKYGDVDDGGYLVYSPRSCAVVPPASLRRLPNLAGEGDQARRVAPLERRPSPRVKGVHAPIVRGYAQYSYMGSIP